MKIEIEGSAKEIAALVLAVQERQNANNLLLNHWTPTMNIVGRNYTGGGSGGCQYPSFYGRVEINDLSGAIEILRNINSTLSSLRTVVKDLNVSIAIERKGI